MQVRQKLRYRQWAVEEDAGVFVQRIHLCETSFGVPHSNLCGYHLNLAKILIIIQHRSMLVAGTWMCSHLATREGCGLYWQIAKVGLS